MPASRSMTIFKAAMDQLGNVLTEHGFQYRRSRRRANRQGKLFEHVITFATSRSTNSLPDHVALEVRALARSEDFGRYRTENGISLPVNEACLFSIPIENIFQEAPPYVRYDLGNDDTRGQVLSSIEDVLTGDVLTAFELIEAPERLQEYVKTRPMPCLDAWNALQDYLGFTAALNGDT